MQQIVRHALGDDDATAELLIGGVPAMTTIILEELSYGL